ncbi:hypothetical protein [Microcystis aeruginosa]|uniref:hypothetical protein n=1 Tax=Microcystis aeruginosa TaxID=1126 RepID=UPI001EDF3999|nr:hypothetical protein [Microcystis aeruginosa]WNF16983.1 hypothetical protein RKE53_16955 [Microcystis aeruginosa NRERC-214]
MHTYGLLHKSFRPDEATCVLRALVRHREMLLRYRASHIQHIQKILQQMNLKLTNVISDVTPSDWTTHYSGYIVRSARPQGISQT